MTLLQIDAASSGCPQLAKREDQSSERENDLGGTPGSAGAGRMRQLEQQQHIYPACHGRVVRDL
jgi:hypothetical protein